MDIQEKQKGGVQVPIHQDSVVKIGGVDTVVNAKTAKFFEENKMTAQEAKLAHQDPVPSFELKKWDHKEAKGIYAVSKPVKAYRHIAKVAADMVRWLDANNGKFDNTYKVAYAISHCQVEADPFSFFVLSDEFIDTGRRLAKDTKKNFYFPSRVIVNARIVEAPEKIDARIPKREVVKDKDGKISSQIKVTEGSVNNRIYLEEACMSFAHRSPKKKERYYRVKVRYQVPRKILGITYLKTITEVAEGLKAHIFQHEIDHANGINMYFDKKK